MRRINVFIFLIFLQFANYVSAADHRLEDNLRAIAHRSAELSKRISDKSKELIDILSDYQTQDVSVYEIRRSIKMLDGLHHNHQFMGSGKKLASVALMLPSNLPLYSLVIFAAVPSFMSEIVYIRPNALLQEHDIVRRIAAELELENLFPEMNIKNIDHAGFKKYIENAELVIFTGKPSNANSILLGMKENSLLAINGAGHNPIVVAEGADIDKAVASALLVKGFNGGQDCAGADAILVHHTVAAEFIAKFIKQYSELPVGSFKDPGVVIGPIKRVSELLKFGHIFHENRMDIIDGGVIDFRHGIVQPTTIVRGIERSPNFKEMFGPVAFIHPYSNDSDLSYYFDDIDGQYNANRMYVSLFGNSDYINCRDDTVAPGARGNVGIVLREQSIHDVEIGYRAYGGYSLGASGLIKKSPRGLERAAMPILLPEVIEKHLFLDKPLPYEIESKEEAAPKIISIKKGKEVDPVVQQFRDLAKDIFGNNLLFGFVFGSAAKGKLKVRGPNVDDLDTFICLKEEAPINKQRYFAALADLHRQHGLKVDDDFPAEIMTLTTLQKSIDGLADYAVSVSSAIKGDEFDHVFWSHALTDKKVGFIGDGKLMSSLIKKANPLILKWSKQVISQLKMQDEIPKRVAQRFVGLSKEAIIEKLSGYSPHLIVHLGLDWDDNSDG